MRVNIKDQEQQVQVAEMSLSGDVGYVYEMATDPAKLAELVPVEGISEKAAAIALAAEDEKPEYPVIRVEEGWSESGRLWPANELASIVKQTNELEPVGHLGHIPESEAATAFPDVQTTWLGALVRQEPSKQKDRVGEMVSVAYFAGYNHPGAKIRRLLRTRSVRGISWWGRADMKPIPGHGVEISGFELKAIDWARKLAEGMPTSRVVAIASEMEDNAMELDLSQVTPEQFKKDNPNGHALLVNEAQTEMKDQIGEMEAKITEGDEAKGLLDQITTALKIEKPSDALDAIAALMTRLGDKAKATVDKLMGDILAEKVQDEGTRKYVAGLLVPTVGEMEAKVADATDEEAAKTIVSEMIDAQFNSNDLIKELVSEQAPPIVRRREELGGNGGENNEYMKQTERVLIGG